MVRKGWKQVTLGDIALFQGGSQPPLSVFSSQKKAGYIRLVQIRDYKTDKYATYIPEKLAKRFCKQDDIMIGRYGPPIFQILRGIEGAYNVALIKALPQGVDKEFLYHTLKREDLFQYIDLLSRRTSGQTGVDLTNLKAFELSIPVLTDEQAAIAKALSDVDSLTSSLQKLIEKKKAIKQGAMQELLTGKKRLPGFSEEWAYRRVGEICSITKGQIITEKTAIHGNVPVIAGGKTPAFYHNVANRESDVITISASGANAGYIAYHDYPIFASDCSTIESSDQYDVKFIYYALLYHQQELIGMQTGGAQPHIHPKEIGVLLVPRINQEEQRAIANVLSDMDSEIEQLEKKLAKYQQIKQGMMQELLTGRIRLKEGENNA